MTEHDAVPTAPGRDGRGDGPTILDLVREIAETSRDTTEQGTRFEQLMLQVLPDVDLAELTGHDVAEDSWCRWLDWSKRDQYGEASPDTGVDLVGRITGATDRYVIVQCKCHTGASKADKLRLANFLSFLGKDWCAAGLWIDTAETPLTSNEQTRFANTEAVVVDRETVAGWPTPTQPTRRVERKALRAHQIEALNDAAAKDYHGRIIMACGTGKTLVGLHAAERTAETGRPVIVCVPSIALLHQTVRAWREELGRTMLPVSVCSANDTTGSKPDYTDWYVISRSTTSPAEIARRTAGAIKSGRMPVIFTTYHSLERVVDAQTGRHGGHGPVPRASLVIADEAHRTAGVTSSSTSVQKGFRRIHETRPDHAVQTERKLFMTATPRVWSDREQSTKLEQQLVYSMDDETLYGPLLHTLSYTKAVDLGLVADTKLLVLTYDPDSVARDAGLQKLMDAKRDGGVAIDDLTKIIGIWRATQGADNPPVDEERIPPLSKMLLFTNTRKRSRAVAEVFAKVHAALNNGHDIDKAILDIEQGQVRAEHVDGMTPPSKRNTALEVLAAGIPGDARIVTNVKVLGEGVDVPELEGVVFYDPRTSTTDMVQAIGRISRKQPGAAKTAYVVVPLVLKRDENREAVLKRSADWKTLYQTIATLRSIDEAFVSQIECAVVEAEASTNRKPPRPGGGDDTNEDPPLTAGIEGIRIRGADPNLTTAIRRQIGPAVVKICGSKLYWDSWGRSIAQTYRAVRTRLEGLYETSEKTRRAVDGATETLHRAIHRGIDTPQTLRMLAQHQISDRVFRALFGEYYTELGRTPAARAVQAATEALNGTGLGNETDALEGLYEKIEARVEYIKTDDARQHLLRDLYDTFFRHAFDEGEADTAAEDGEITAADRGIAYTPLELVDWLLDEADRTLREIAPKGSDERRLGLAAPNVSVVDGFSGTGTFIARLIGTTDRGKSYWLPDDVVRRKWAANEFHANEIELLPHMIGVANIENEYQWRTGQRASFSGGVFTDTFEETTRRDLLSQQEDELPNQGAVENHERRYAQQTDIIEVFVGNPPWNVFQGKGGDRKNIVDRVNDTYAAESNQKLKQSNYNDYKLAIRWAIDRIRKDTGYGVIAFVTDGGWIEANAADGFRKCLLDDATSIRVVNLKGNANTAGAEWKRQGDKIFGQGSKSPTALLVIAIGLNAARKPATVRYAEVGDGQSRAAKLEWLSQLTRNSPDWIDVTPNAKSEWLNQSQEEWPRYIGLADPKGRYNKEPETVFRNPTAGQTTHNDALMYAETPENLRSKLHPCIEYLDRVATQVRTRARNSLSEHELHQIARGVGPEPTGFRWHRELIKLVQKRTQPRLREADLRTVDYRPFWNRQTWHVTDWVATRYGQPKVFPTHIDNPELDARIPDLWNALNTPDAITRRGLDRALLEATRTIGGNADGVQRNLMINVEGPSASGSGSVWAAKRTTDLHLTSAAQNFARYWYDKKTPTHDNVTAHGRDTFRSTYQVLQSEPNDELGWWIMMYVYGVLSDPRYRDRYRNELRRTTPRLPLLAEFERLTAIGGRLLMLHACWTEHCPPQVVGVADHGGAPMLDASFREAGARVRKIKWADKTRKDLISLTPDVTLAGVTSDTHLHRMAGYTTLERFVQNTAPMMIKAYDQDCPEENTVERWHDRINRVVWILNETARLLKLLPNVDYDEAARIAKSATPNPVAL